MVIGVGDWALANILLPIYFSAPADDQYTRVLIRGIALPMYKYIWCVLSRPPAAAATTRRRQLPRLAAALVLSDLTSPQQPQDLLCAQSIRIIRAET